MTFTNWIAKPCKQRDTLNVLHSLVSAKALLLFLRNGARGRGGISQSHMFKKLHKRWCIGDRKTWCSAIFSNFAICFHIEFTWFKTDVILTMCNHGSVACFNAELSSSSMGEYILGTSARVDLLQNKCQTRKQKSQATTTITQREHCPQHQKANHQGIAGLSMHIHRTIRATHAEGTSVSITESCLQGSHVLPPPLNSTSRPYHLRREHVVQYPHCKWFWKWETSRNMQKPIPVQRRLIIRGLIKGYTCSRWSVLTPHSDW